MTSYLNHAIAFLTPWWQQFPIPCPDGESEFDIDCHIIDAMPMNISLTEQLEKFITEQVASGAYQTASEVVRDGLRLLADRRKAEELKLEALRAAVREGLDSGPAEPLDMEEIIADARARHQRRA